MAKHSFLCFSILFSVLVISGRQSVAQTGGSIIGRLVDADSGKPIPFATVRIMKDHSLLGGIVSNQEGSFRIPITAVNESAEISISCIGYTGRIMKIFQLARDQVNTIRLNAVRTELSEVTVTSKKRGRLSAGKIVQFAIKSIPSNYPTSPYSYLAYYRDYQTEAKSYINLNEAIIHVHDQGFQTSDFDSTKVSLSRYRNNGSFPIDTTTQQAYTNVTGSSKFIPSATVFSFGGNELSILRIHDPVRNYKELSFSYVNDLRTDFVKNHSFRLLGIVVQDNIRLYHIAFESFYFVTQGDHIARGEIFIEQNNYAIHKLVYSNYLKHDKEERLLYDIHVEYSRSDSLMYLNYVSVNNIFRLLTPAGFQVTNTAFDRQINAFIFTFNRQPEYNSAVDPRNYVLKFDGKPFRISRVEIPDDNPSEVRVFVSNAEDFNLRDNITSVMKKLAGDVKRVKDLNGNEVNVMKYKDVDQFREMFVVKVDKPSESHGPEKFIAKERPLSHNRLSLGSLPVGMDWMNTPLKSDSDWVSTNKKAGDIAEPPKTEEVKVKPLPGQDDIGPFDETVYLHTDKSYYYPGDKVWFKAYMSYTTPRLRDSLSRVLYVDWLDSTGIVMQSRLVRINDGIGRGDFTLPKVAGNYYLRAYTNWMLNYGDSSVFVEPVKVLPSLQMPQPGQEGGRGPVSPLLFISSSKATYAPREEIKLVLNLRDNTGRPIKGNVSVSVTDTEQVVPVPDEFNILRNLSTPKETAIVADSSIKPVEYSTSIHGIYRNRKSLSAKTKLMAVQANGDQMEDVAQIITDTLGRFTIDGFQLRDSASIGLKVDGAVSRKDEFMLVPRRQPQLGHLPPAHVFNLAAGNSDIQAERIARLEADAKFLNEVTVNASRIKDKPSNPYYGRADYSVSREKVMEYNDIITSLLARVPGLQYNGSSLAFSTASFKGNEPLLIIDDVRMSSDPIVPTLRSLDISTIERIDVLKYEGAAIYGTAGAAGVIIIHTRQSQYQTSKKTPMSLDLKAFHMFSVGGYSTPSDFVTPDYNKTSDLGAPDNRATILWQPNLIVEGTSELRFFAADQPSRYRIVVEGMTSDFKPIRTEAFIEIAK